MSIGKLIRRLTYRSEPSGLNVAINMKPRRTPWGGGNQFVDQLTGHLESRGHKVTFKLKPQTSAILLVEPRNFASVQFGVPEIVAFKKAYPGAKCVHRINECDLRKGTNEVDEILRQANRTADYTVFISNWICEYFLDRWFDRDRPYTIIQNGADSKVYYPDIEKKLDFKKTFHVVTHHWSDNWNKGFAVYQEVDRLIENGSLEGFELMVVGRWPKEIVWKSAVTHPPTKGKKLANLLRKNHVYLTASLWEPCGMHHIEGAQCGLPLVYHEDGGGIVEFGRLYGIGFRDDVRKALLQAKERYPTLRKQTLESAPSGKTMCEEYERTLIW